MWRCKYGEWAYLLSFSSHSLSMTLFNETWAHMTFLRTYICITHRYIIILLLLLYADGMTISREYSKLPAISVNSFFSIGVVFRLADWLPEISLLQHMSVDLEIHTRNVAYKHLATISPTCFVLSIITKWQFYWKTRRRKT